jgi:hypothetical protein
MTLIDAAVMATLRATSTIAALVGGRVYPDALPPSPTLPAVTVRKISDTPDPEIGRAHRARVQVSCWSNPTPAHGVRSPAEVEGLAAAVAGVVHTARLNGSPTSMTAGTTSYSVLSMRAAIGPRLIEDGSGYYHIPVDVLAEFTE